MFTIKYKDINNAAFPAALNKLMEAKGMHSKVAFNIAKIEERISWHMEAGKKEFKAILDKFGAKFDAESGLAVADDKKEEFAKELDKFMNTELNMPQWKISLGDISDAGLSPKELSALECLLVTLEVVPGANA